MVGIAPNSFPTEFSFINAMAELWEATGADVELLADAISYDDRIGHTFLDAGLGLAGGYRPEDVRAFMACAGELAREVRGGSLLGKRVAVLGQLRA